MFLTLFLTHAAPSTSQKQFRIAREFPREHFERKNGVFELAKLAGCQLRSFRHERFDHLVASGPMRSFSRFACMKNGATLDAPHPECLLPS